MGQVLEQVQRTILDPMFSALLPDFDSPQARVMLLAIGLQESRFSTRVQVGRNGPGPARGFWQFERLGGVQGVLKHRTTRHYALMVCEARNVDPNAGKVWKALESDDILAAAFARLLLWSDPQPLPAIGDGNAAWDCYLRNWRPGKPHPSTWGGLYAQAMASV